MAEDRRQRVTEVVLSEVEVIDELEMVFERYYRDTIKPES